MSEINYRRHRELWNIKTNIYLTGLKCVSHMSKVHTIILLKPCQTVYLIHGHTHWDVASLSALSERQDSPIYIFILLLKYVYLY